ncbi:MAG: carboxypeptidase-like regulatory domain-containing protein, partial [Bacteroidales bacterium]|nr:carboxypeptidase-like regulatory domain-containing protein [Candidatus Sodaliphilus fimicaballi]
DVDKLGQQYLYTNTDNIFLAPKRQKDDKILYLRKTELEYKYETQNHFSVAISFEHNIHEQSKFLEFTHNDGNQVKRYTEAGFKATLRYAPGEKFYQTRSYRIPINMDAPIVTLTQTYMPKGFMGSKYEINKTELGIQKRFWFSAFGYTDIIVKGGKLWSKASYPDLLLPNANLSYTIQPESYDLMSAMEFVNDQYLSWDVTYWGNGVLMNRLPLIKKLKLREVISMRGLWGSLSDKNNPAKSDDLFMFPAETLSQTMEKTPYMEMAVGLDNIFTILRVDYVWRLSYRHTPGVDRNGVRIQLHFTF